MLLYIHIPFCDSKCHYCAFNSFTTQDNLKSQYIDALLIQLDYEFNHFNVKKKSIETVYFGGGTPSVIDAKYYEKIFNKINQFLKNDIEITIEANPNSVTLDWLKALKDFGINRISFGVQSFNNDKLKFLGRKHTDKEAIEAIENSYKIGIKNISLDLIYGVKNDNKDLLLKDINTAFSLPINHISAYSLTIEENTYFFKKPILEVVNNDDNLGNFVRKEIEKNGFINYEVSSYGKYKSKHNLGYWGYKNYIGVGAGAVGFSKNKRFYPKENIKEYIENPTISNIENLNDYDIKIEKIFLGFRSSIGVHKSIFNKIELKKIDILLQEKKLKQINHIFYCLDYFLADEITLFIT